MYFPPLDEVKAAAGQGTVIPVYREVLADLETPVSAYLKVRRGSYSFLLESVEGGERVGRYSFIGTEPYRVLEAERGGPEDPLRAVEEELARFKPVPVAGVPAFSGGAVGFLSYEAVRHYEPRVQPQGEDTLGVPEAHFMFADTLLVFDHVQHVIKVVSYVRLDGDIESAYRQAMWKIDELVARLAEPLTRLPENGALNGNVRAQPDSNIPREDYLMSVDRVKEYIVAGDAIQVVLSRRLSRPTAAHPFNIYRSLRHVNPSPYMFYLDFGGYQLVGASPELLVNVEDGKIDYHPIAGTRPRGKTLAEDQELEQELIGSEKERAEHIMLVDLGRNDVGRVSAPGTVKVTDLMSIERYSHVMHIVSHVTGKLRDDLTPFDALRSCFPAGTVSGAPKIRAMEIIAEMEPDQRGVYAGCVGYFSFSGNIETCITIRTLVVKDGVAHVQAGGGIVFDSDPSEELQETLNKARASLRAIDQAETIGAGMRYGSLGY